MTWRLRVEDLRVEVATAGGRVPVVDGVSLDVADGACLGLVGESGCGKTLTALSILRLVPGPGVRLAGGRVLWRRNGGSLDLLGLRDREMRRVRGREIAMVFQEPMTSMNPAFTVGDQVGEVLRCHLGVPRREARRRSVELLARVGIRDAHQWAARHPHELSGGMLQRAMIAMALALAPRLLIADEPTTAVDVTLQAQVLGLLRDLQAEEGMALLLVTHDLAVVAGMARDVAVMYAGRIVERAGCADLFREPLHPYTAGLLRCVPRLGSGRGRLEAIPGVVPGPGSVPQGCPFRDRCLHAEARCSEEEPRLIDRGDGRLVACHPAQEGRLPGEGPL